MAGPFFSPILRPLMDNLSLFSRLVHQSFVSCSTEILCLNFYIWAHTQTHTLQSFPRKTFSPVYPILPGYLNIGSNSMLETFRWRTLCYVGPKCKKSDNNRFKFRKKTNLYYLLYHIKNLMLMIN